MDITHIGSREGHPRFKCGLLHIARRYFVFGIFIERKQTMVDATNGGKGHVVREASRTSSNIGFNRVGQGIHSRGSDKLAGERHHKLRV